MKTYKAISRTSGKELQVMLGLVQKTSYVNIADQVIIEQKSKNFEVVGKAIIPGYGEIDSDVQIYMLKGKLVFKANDDKVGIDCFVEGAHEIELFFEQKSQKSEKQEKEYKEYLRQFNL